MSDYLRITVKLTPKAAKNAVMGWMQDAQGQDILKCCVTAIPEKGKANQALIKLLSKYWKVPKSNITLIRGETEPVKILEIQGLNAEQIQD